MAKETGVSENELAEMAALLTLKKKAAAVGMGEIVCPGGFIKHAEKKNFTKLSKLGKFL